MGLERKSIRVCSHSKTTRMPFLRSFAIILCMLSQTASVSNENSVFCSDYRKFVVQNCSSCPEIDTSRGNAPLTQCTPREHAGGRDSMCACSSLTIGVTVSQGYFPIQQDNGTSCVWIHRTGSDGSLAPFYVERVFFLVFSLFILCAYVCWICDLQAHTPKRTWKSHLLCASHGTSIVALICEDL